MKKPYTVVTQVELDGAVHKPGSELQLTEEQAQYLLERGAVAPKLSAAVTTAKAQRASSNEAA